MYYLTNEEIKELNNEGIDLWGNTREEGYLDAPIEIISGYSSSGVFDLLDNLDLCAA